MPKKKPTQASTPSEPLVGSSSEYTHKVETVCVRYQNGKPLQIVHPLHLTCLRSIAPRSIKKGGRPSGEQTVRYVLNRVLFDYLFIPRDTPPQPLTRYGLVTLALKRCEYERNRIEAFTRSTPKRKERLKNEFIISRDTFDNFLKPFFTKPRQRLSLSALRQLFPRLWYRKHSDIPNIPTQ